jgi:hypothetical protein
MKPRIKDNTRNPILGILRRCLFQAWELALLLGASRVLAQIPENALPIRIGADQTGNSRFTGQMALPGMENSGGLSLFVNGVRHGEGAVPDDLVYPGSVAPPESPLTAWYQRPAARWSEALPMGNGRLGGMVWGGVAGDRIDLNEDTLWSGEPYDNLHPKGLAALPEIRRLLLAGKNGEAQELVERDMNGRYNQSYQPLGDLQVDFSVTGEVPGYRRELDLQTAVTRTTFLHDGVRYTREVFASFSAQAIVIRLSADKPGSVSYQASLGCQLHHTTKAGQGSGSYHQT